MDEAGGGGAEWVGGLGIRFGVVLGGGGGGQLGLKKGGGAYIA